MKNQKRLQNLNIHHESQVQTRNQAQRRSLVLRRRKAQRRNIVHERSDSLQRHQRLLAQRLNLLIVFQYLKPQLENHRQSSLSLLRSLRNLWRNMKSQKRKRKKNLRRLINLK